MKLTIVNVFMAYENGQLIPVAATVEMSVLDVQKRQIEAVVDSQLFTLQRKVEVIDQKIDTGFAAVIGKLDGLDQKVEVVADDCKRRRKDVSWEDRAKIISCLYQRRGGICPPCNVTEILNHLGLPNAEFEIDHFFRRDLAALHQVWPVCHRCNQRLNDSSYRQQRQERLSGVAERFKDSS